MNFDRSDEELLSLCSSSVEAQEILLERYARLVKAYARRFYLLGGDYEDLVQEGMIGLLNAIRQYQPAEGPFSSYAPVCVRSRLISAVRAASAKKHSPLNDSVSISEYSSDTVFPDFVSGSPEDVLLDRELYSDVLSGLLLLLSPLEKRVFQVYLKGLSASEIAQELGIPLKSVLNALHRIRIKASGLLPRR